jgi:hypothetical protein
MNRIATGVISEFKGETVFLLAGDALQLERVQKITERLGLGSLDVEPELEVELDGWRIIFSLASESACSSLSVAGGGEKTARWRMDRDRAVEVAAIIGSVVLHHGPSHAYIDMNGGSLPVVVSKDEY